MKLSTVTDSKGNDIYEYAPSGSFKAVLIASKDINVGEKYKITIGNETFETEIESQSTVIGVQRLDNIRGNKMN